jgi:hypothetical protein
MDKSNDKSGLGLIDQSGGLFPKTSKWDDDYK